MKNIIKLPIKSENSIFDGEIFESSIFETSGNLITLEIPKRVISLTIQSPESSYFDEKAFDSSAFETKGVLLKVKVGLK